MNKVGLAVACATALTAAVALFYGAPRLDVLAKVLEVAVELLG